MRLIPIPPPNLHDQIKGQYPDKMHMILPQSCQNPLYYEHYREPRVESMTGGSGWRILDNGEAEGDRLPPKALYSLAKDVQANEIVLPDALGEAEETLKLVKDFGKHVKHDYQHMGVLQGQNYAQVYMLYEEFDTIPYVRSIGIPRHFVKTIAPDARYAIAREIRRRRPNTQIHLLGLNMHFVNEPAFIARELPGQVRSIDTSAPFNYARYGMVLSTKRKIPRPYDWMMYEWDEAEKLLAGFNIRRLRAWCRGETPDEEAPTS